MHVLVHCRVESSLAGVANFSPNNIATATLQIETTISNAPITAQIGAAAYISTVRQTLLAINYNALQKVLDFGANIGPGVQSVKLAADQISTVGSQSPRKCVCAAL